MTYAAPLSPTWTTTTRLVRCPGVAGFCGGMSSSGKVMRISGMTNVVTGEDGEEGAD